MGRAHNGFGSFETIELWSAPNLHSKAYEPDRTGTYPSRVMDFCHPCQRHLNGALACPGCGTPVETLRAQRQEPVAPAGYEGEAYGAARVGEDPGGYDDEPHGRREPEPNPDEAPVARESRRDRKAAAHRRRRNRTLLIVAGFVLATGGLSLTELGTDAPESTPKPTAAGEETADGGGTELEPAKSPSGAPAAVTSAESPGPGASGSPSASESPEDEESEKADDEAGQDASSAPVETPTTDPATPEAPEAPEEPETPEPDPTTKEPEPEPEPEPSETCDRFLWWCT